MERSKNPKVYENQAFERDPDIEGELYGEEEAELEQSSVSFWSLYRCATEADLPWLRQLVQEAALRRIG